MSVDWEKIAYERCRYKRERDEWRKKCEDIHSKILRPLFEHYDSDGKKPIPSLLECERVIDNWPGENKGELSAESKARVDQIVKEVIGRG